MAVQEAEESNESQDEDTAPLVGGFYNNELNCVVILCYKPC